MTDASGWVEKLDRVARYIGDQISVRNIPTQPGVFVEPKGLAVAIHWRQAPDQEAVIRSIAEEIRRDEGLILQDGKMCVELVPDFNINKGTTFAELAESSESACFIGDDLGDLSVFRALDEMASSKETLKVAVSGPEAPAALIGSADLVLASPVEAIDFLKMLLDQSL